MPRADEAAGMTGFRSCSEEPGTVRLRQARTLVTPARATRKPSSVVTCKHATPFSALVQKTRGVAKVQPYGSVTMPFTRSKSWLSAQRVSGLFGGAPMAPTSPQLKLTPVGDTSTEPTGPLSGAHTSAACGMLERSIPSGKVHQARLRVITHEIRPDGLVNSEYSSRV